MCRPNCQTVRDRMLVQIANTPKVFFASYPFYCFNSLIKTRYLQKILFRYYIRLNVAVGLCNAILVTEIFCYRYSIINNFANKQHFSTKCSDRFKNLLEIKCRKLYSNSFRFVIFIVQCLEVYFSGHSANFYKLMLFLCYIRWHAFCFFTLRFFLCLTLIKY